MKIVRSEHVWGSLIGVVLGALLVIGFRRYARDFLTALIIGDTGLVRSTSAGLIVVGAVMGVGVVASRYSWLITAIPTVLLLALYVPQTISIETPTWYPVWLRESAYLGFGPAPLVVVGVLGAVTAWRLIEHSHSLKLGK